MNEKCPYCDFFGNVDSNDWLDNRTLNSHMLTKHATTMIKDAYKIIDDLNKGETEHD